MKLLIDTEIWKGTESPWTRRKSTRTVSSDMATRGCGVSGLMTPVVYVLEGADGRGAKGVDFRFREILSWRRNSSPLPCSCGRIGPMPFWLAAAFLLLSYNRRVCGILQHSTAGWQAGSIRGICQSEIMHRLLSALRK